MGGNWSSTVGRRSVSLLIVGCSTVGKSSLIDAAWEHVYAKYQPRLLAEDSWLVNLPDISLNITDDQDLPFNQMDRKSFLAVQEKWIPMAKSNLDLSIVIVGLKMDRRDDLLKQQKKKKPTKAKSSSALSDAKSASPAAPTSPVASAPCAIAQLPPEVLLRIFSGLSTRELLNCMQVCKQWKSITSNKYLWKTREWGKFITTEEGLKLAHDAEAKKYIECCAITGKGVKEVFKEAVKAAVDAVNERLTLGSRERKEKEAQQRAAQEKGKGPAKEKEKDKDKEKEKDKDKEKEKEKDKEKEKSGAGETKQLEKPNDSAASSSIKQP